MPNPGPKWTPWILSVREDGSGDLYEWSSCMVICPQVGVHEHHKEVYCPVAFLADSIPDDPELRDLVLRSEWLNVMNEMKKYGCHHKIPPIPPLPVDTHA